MSFAENLAGLKYYWDEKKDLECSSYYSVILPELQKRYPEILKTWSDYKIAEHILTVLLDKAVEENPSW